MQMKPIRIQRSTRLICFSTAPHPSLMPSLISGKRWAKADLSFLFCIIILFCFFVGLKTQWEYIYIYIYIYIWSAHYFTSCIKDANPPRSRRMFDIIWSNIYCLWLINSFSVTVKKVFEVQIPLVTGAHKKHWSGLFPKRIVSLNWFQWVYDVPKLTIRLGNTALKCHRRDCCVSNVQTLEMKDWPFLKRF